MTFELDLQFMTYTLSLHTMEVKDHHEIQTCIYPRKNGFFWKFVEESIQRMESLGQ